MNYLEGDVNASTSSVTSFNLGVTIKYLVVCQANSSSGTFFCDVEKGVYWRGGSYTITLPTSSSGAINAIDYVNGTYFGFGRTSADATALHYKVFY